MIELAKLLSEEGGIESILEKGSLPPHLHISAVLEHVLRDGETVASKIGRRMSFTR